MTTLTLTYALICSTRTTSNDSFSCNRNPTLLLDEGVTTVNSQIVLELA